MLLQMALFHSFSWCSSMYVVYTQQNVSHGGGGAATSHCSNFCPLIFLEPQVVSLNFSCHQHCGLKKRGPLLHTRTQWRRSTLPWTVCAKALRQERETARKPPRLECKEQGKGSDDRKWRIEWGIHRVLLDSLIVREAPEGSESGAGHGMIYILI